MNTCYQKLFTIGPKKGKLLQRNAPTPWLSQGSDGLGEDSCRPAQIGLRLAITIPQKVSFSNGEEKTDKDDWK